MKTEQMAVQVVVVVTVCHLVVVAEQEAKEAMEQRLRAHQSMVVGVVVVQARRVNHPPPSQRVRVETVVMEHQVASRAVQ
jgi:hypothetical protein